MMRRATGLALATMLAMAIGMTGTASAKSDRAECAKKLSDAGAVYTELIGSTDKAIPKELLDHAKCIAILPHVLKAAVGVGARHGDGVMICRTETGWSNPVFVNISGGSWGAQLGVESTDLVLFFMNDRGARSLVEGSKLTLGGKASIAAGPFGRSGEAATNLELRAEIYSYARTKGLFAGLSLEGAKLSLDKDDMVAFYGSELSATDVLFGKGPATTPEEVEAFRKVLP